MTISQDNNKNSDQQTNNETLQTPDEPEIIDIKDARITQLEEECSKLKESWVRAVAETDNIRKRSQRDLEENKKYAITSFATDMVNVLENLKRATEIIPSGQTEEAENLLKIIGEGINLTLQDLLNIFQKYNIIRIDPLGQKFDHNFHQAVAQIENNDVEAGTIVQVVQAGYMIADRLLRPAMVAVSKTSGSDTKKLDTTA